LSKVNVAAQKTMVLPERHCEDGFSSGRRIGSGMSVFFRLAPKVPAFYWPLT